jgi:antitoxin PrlF
MAIVTVSEKGQVVIPASIRRRLGITAGSKLELVEDCGALRLTVQRTRKLTRHDDGYGMLAYRGEPRSLAQFGVADAMRQGRRR